MFHSILQFRSLFARPRSLRRGQWPTRSLARSSFPETNSLAAGTTERPTLRSPNTQVAKLRSHTVSVPGGLLRQAICSRREYNRMPKASRIIAIRLTLNTGHYSASPPRHSATTCRSLSTSGSSIDSKIPSAASARVIASSRSPNSLNASAEFQRAFPSCSRSPKRRAAASHDSSQLVCLCDAASHHPVVRCRCGHAPRRLIPLGARVWYNTSN